MLALISTLPLIPTSWRTALALFNSALAAVAAGVDAGEVTAQFKAGKDL